MKDTYYLKLTGKVNVPEMLTIGHNYRVLLDGEVTNETKETNQDGTFSYVSKFEPVIAEVQKDFGKSIKSKVAGSRSKQVKNIVFKLWEASNDDSRTADEAYEETMKHILFNLGDLYEEAKRK